MFVLITSRPSNLDKAVYQVSSSIDGCYSARLFIVGDRLSWWNSNELVFASLGAGIAGAVARGGGSESTPDVAADRRWCSRVDLGSAPVRFIVYT